MTSLLEAFMYDLWANRLWIDTLDRFESHRLPAQETMRHLLMAQATWWARVTENETPRVELDLTCLEDLHERWLTMVTKHNLATTYTYQNLRGETFTNTLEQIARHVVNHGTYHRGHLRGLAQAEGLTDFPDTDYILYLRQA